MTILIMPTILTDLFVCKDGRFTAGASHLNGHLALHRIYDNHPYAEGIALRNPRTGNVVRFAFERTVCDNAGAVIAWHFLPIPEDKHRHPMAGGVTILND